MGPQTIIRLIADQYKMKVRPIISICKLVVVAKWLCWDHPGLKPLLAWSSTALLCWPSSDQHHPITMSKQANHWWFWFGWTNDCTWIQTPGIRRTSDGKSQAYDHTIQIVTMIFTKGCVSHWSRAGLHWDHLVVCSLDRHHAENGPLHRKMLVDCPLVIISNNLFQTKPRKRSEWSFSFVEKNLCKLESIQ